VIPVFDNDDGDLGIAEQSANFGSGTIHARAHFGLDAHYRLACLYSPLAQSRHLTVKIGLQVIRRD
jgi:hypothetical protein